MKTKSRPVREEEAAVARTREGREHAAAKPKKARPEEGR
jgi:hypothetical protein